MHSYRGEKRSNCNFVWFLFSLSLSISSCLNFFFYSWSLDPVQESGSCLLVFIVLLREESLPTFSFISLSMINLFLYKLPTFSCYLYVVFSYFCLSFKPTWKSSCLLFNVIAVFPPLISFTQMNGLECVILQSVLSLFRRRSKKKLRMTKARQEKRHKRQAVCVDKTLLFLFCWYSKRQQEKDKNEWMQQ